MSQLPQIASALLLTVLQLTASNQTEYNPTINYMSYRFHDDMTDDPSVVRYRREHNAECQCPLNSTFELLSEHIHTRQQALSRMWFVETRYHCMTAWEQHFCDMATQEMRIPRSDYLTLLWLILSTERIQRDSNAQIAWMKAYGPNQTEWTSREHDSTSFSEELVQPVAFFGDILSQSITQFVYWVDWCGNSVIRVVTMERIRPIERLVQIGLEWLTGEKVTEESVQEHIRDPEDDTQIMYTTTRKRRIASRGRLKDEHFLESILSGIVCLGLLYLVASIAEFLCGVFH